MRQDPKLKTFARKLAQMCMHAGHAAQNRVQEVLESLQPLPPTRRKAILKLFLAALEREMAKYEATVEHAGPVSDDVQETIKEQLKTFYGHSINLTLSENEALIAGVRVRVSDDVFDASLVTRLNALASGIS